MSIQLRNFANISLLELVIVSIIFVYVSTIFYQRLKSFMQGEPLQRNDVEDMLMLSTLELYDKLIIVTEDNKMKNFLKENAFDIGNEICEKLIMK